MKKLPLLLFSLVLFCIYALFAHSTVTNTNVPRYERDIQGPLQPNTLSPNEIERRTTITTTTEQNPQYINRPNVEDYTGNPVVNDATTTTETTETTVTRETR